MGAADVEGLRLAPLRTRALDGTTRHVPGDLPADRTLVVLAYRQRHQPDVDAWIARAVELGVPATPRGATVPLGTAVIEVPFLSGLWLPARRLIDGGMAQGIADPDVLARTLTAYGSPAAHRRACGLDDGTGRGGGGETVEALVAGRDGTVLAHLSGPPSDSDPAQVDALLTALTA
jgi:hypothetical protein